MKLQIASLAAVLPAVNELMARVLVQGVEQALVSAAVNWSVRYVKAVMMLLRKAD